MCANFFSHKACENTNSWNNARYRYPQIDYIFLTRALLRGSVNFCRSERADRYALAIQAFRKLTAVTK
jgi:hypothetical protein